MNLPFTGERYVPGVQGEIWLEHWHRYHFAARWAAGKRVLDVACGEGYGTSVLARHAAGVTGVDVSAEAI
ncbi:MAG TPA: class I SAM-dependent methyltransferase, partial [Usitatibacter sp.]|nr:class I SAM-dependent methyltransferase [Usitatibacter sp.]